jgi:uncharacterized membrane protein
VATAGTGTTLVHSVFTLIVSLAVIALSAAVVLRIVLGEEPQPATRPPRATGQPRSDRPPAPGPGESTPTAAATSPVAVPAEPFPADVPVAVPAEPSPSGLPVTAPAPPAEAKTPATAAPATGSPVADDRPRARPRRPPARHPVRSGVLLVLLLTAVGCLLALVVAVVLGLLVTAMRAGLG